MLLLCQNSLHYQKGFCIESLLGITLDTDEVFLVSVKQESVKQKDNVSSKTPEHAETIVSFPQPSCADQPSKRPENRPAAKFSGPTCRAAVKKTLVSEETPYDENLVFTEDKLRQAFRAALRSKPNPKSSGTQHSRAIRSANTPTYASEGSLGSSPSRSSMDSPPQQAVETTIGASGQQHVSPPATMNIDCDPQRFCGKRRALHRFEGHVPLEIKDFMKRSSRVYICKICDFRATNCDRKREHMTKHTNENYFICLGCNETFPTMYRMRSHIRDMHI